MPSLKSYSLDEMLKWRNHASARATSREQEMVRLFQLHSKVEKKYKKDLVWIKTLNREISERCFPRRMYKDE